MLPSFVTRAPADMDSFNGYVEDAMSKFHFLKNAIMVLTISLGMLAIVGCRTAKIAVSVNMPGEFNLANVSKLAILDFNSISSEPDSGIFEADAETIDIVQGRVSAAFAQNKTYSIARLDAEKIIQDHHNGRISPKTRFDGILYGRVWWQASPEIHGAYPKVVALSAWDNVEYEYKLLGVKMKDIAKVTTQTEEKIAMLPYRAWNATLMLSLTAYKLDSKGNIEKLTETYAIGTLKYGIDNGHFASNYTPIGIKRTNRADSIQGSPSSWKTALGSLASVSQVTSDFYNLAQGGKEQVDVTGRFKPTKNTVTFPTALETKFTLADQLVAALVPKLMPVNVTFEIERSFDDLKLFHLLKNGAFKAGAEYCDTCLAENASADVSKELEILQNVGETSDQSLYASLSEIKIDKKTKKYIETNIDYFFAKALCEEASGHFSEALRGYRFIFHFAPSKESARGISRCLFALDMGNEVKKIKKDVKKSLRKADLE